MGVTYCSRARGMQEQMGMDLVSRVFFGDSGEIWLCHAFPCVLIKVWGPTSAIYGSLKWPPSNSLAKCEQIGAVISSCDFFPCGVKASLEEFEVNGKRHFPVSMQRRGEDKCNSLPIAGLWRSIRVLGYACLGNACPPSSCPSFIVGDHLWYNQNSSKSCHLQQVLLVFIFPALTLGFIEDLALPAVFTHCWKFLWCGWETPVGTSVQDAWEASASSLYMTGVGLSGWLKWQGRWEESGTFFVASLLS